MNVNMRSVVLIGIALVVAGITAFLARSLVNTSKPALPGDQIVTVEVPESKMKILVAASNMSVGHFIKAEDMTWQSWPDEQVHDSYIQQGGEDTPDSFAGAVVNASLAAGEPILRTRLIKPGNRGFMAAVLPAGKRAISIRINATSGNAGFIFPGDRVDILLTHDVPVNNSAGGKASTASVSETVMDNVRILAINQRTDNPTHTPSIGQTATLEVTKKEAEKISLIKRMGELTLILRSLGKPEDTPSLLASKDKRTITWDSEVSSQIFSGTGGSSGRNISVEVFRGGAKKAQKFDFNSLFGQPSATGNAQKGEEESKE